MANTLLAFLGVSIVLIVTPGPDMALVLRNTVGNDRRAGIATACGVAAGLLIWAFVASAGLAALLLAFGPAFTALKVAGAMYLIYLGVQSLRSALGSGSWRLAGSNRTRNTSGDDWVLIRQGLVSNLGNPKIAVFFSSLLPQFAGDDHGAFFPLFALGVLFCLLTLSWLTVYVSLVDRAGGIIQRGSVRRAVEALTGFVLIALALRLATERQ